MRPTRVVLGLLLANLVVSPAGATGIEEDCPNVDPFASIRFRRYPPEQKSIFKAEYQPDDSDEGQPGQEGVDHIAALVVSSHRSKCAPVRLVTVHGGADFDSRGTAFEDSVSVERAFTAMKEIKVAVEAARKAAVEKEEIPDLSVGFTFGGLGTRGAVHKGPTSEAQRAENRFVTVRFAHSPASATETASMPKELSVPESSDEE